MWYFEFWLHKIQVMWCRFVYFMKEKLAVDRKIHIIPKLKLNQSV